MQLLSILCVTFCVGEDNDTISSVTLSPGISEVFENEQKIFQVALCHLETLALERIRVSVWKQDRDGILGSRLGCRRKKLISDLSDLPLYLWTVCLKPGAPKYFSQFELADIPQ